MTEAWLLVDEAAIRRAAGRPSGREPLALPAPRQLERLADPKEALHRALIVASGRTGRRSRRFRPERAVHRLAEYVEDWSALRTLEALRELERATRRAIGELWLELRRE